MLSDRMREYIQQLLEQSLELMKSPETIDEAIEKLKLILKVEPTNAKAHYALAKIYMTKENYVDALLHLEKIQGLDFPEKDVEDEIKKIRQIMREKDTELKDISTQIELKNHKVRTLIFFKERPDIKELLNQMNTDDNRKSSILTC